MRVTVLNPFVVMMDVSQSNGQRYIPLQLGEADGHVAFDVNYWSSAPMERIADTLIPLVLAQKASEDDVKITAMVGGKELWGWFPKECAA